MTYKDLLENLQNLNETELNQTVTLLLDYDDIQYTLDYNMHIETTDEGSLKRGSVFFNLV